MQRTRTTPAEWQTGVMATIFKNRDWRVQSNYWEIIAVNLPENFPECWRILTDFQTLYPRGAVWFSSKLWNSGQDLHPNVSSPKVSCRFGECLQLCSLRHLVGWWCRSIRYTCKYNPLSSNPFVMLVDKSSRHTHGEGCLYLMDLKVSNSLFLWIMGLFWCGQAMIFIMC